MSNRSVAFAYDALGRRIVFACPSHRAAGPRGNDRLTSTIQPWGALDSATRCYYDDMNESAGKDTAGTPNSLRTYVRGISYVDERLMMQDFKDSGSSTDDRPYYYVIDRMYNVRFLRDRAGA
ncbi:MAG: hypothetical protein JXQ75_10325, partial [Phycisphaerae bacterium]|nr:hypothetical protein [Phycisphaerae bacterium]